MKLSPEQKQLQRAAKAEQQQWEQELEEKSSNRGRVFSRPLMLLSAIGGGVGAYLGSDWLLGSTDALVFSLVGAFSGAIVLLVLGFVFKIVFEQGLDEVRKRTARALGVVVDHRVTSRAIGSGTVQGDSLILSVSFEVHGKPHVTEVRPTSSYSNFPGFIEKLKKRYPKGSTLTIAYSPEDPSESGLPRRQALHEFGTRAASLLVYLGIGTTSFLVVLGALALISLLASGA